MLPISRYLPSLSPSVNIERDTHTDADTQRYFRGYPVYVAGYVKTFFVKLC